MFFVLVVWEMSQKGVLSPIISKDFGPERSFDSISMGLFQKGVLPPSV